MSRIHLSLALVLASVLAIATGCQSSGAGASSTASTPKQAVISTGNGTTVVYLPTSDGTGVERLAAADVPRCAQCDADAKAYFATGQLAPKCSACGATRTVVTSQYDSHGHN